MKVICFILALYVLHLSVFPCSDTATCVDEPQAKLVVVDKSHNHSESEQDLCTPFCICSCCAAHVQLTNTAYINFTDLTHNTKLLTPYLERTLLNNSHSIWQPPRFS